MIILFPGAYILSGTLFSLAGAVWACRSKTGRSQGKGASERSPLIQAEDDSLGSILLTESQEIERRLAKKRREGIGSPSFKSGLSFTASM